MQATATLLLGTTLSPLAARNPLHQMPSSGSSPHQRGQRQPGIQLVKILLALLMVLGLIPVTHAQTFVHPGIPFTTADLNQLKANINTAPWSSGYAALAADSHSSLNYGRQGPFVTVSRAPDVNNIAWRNDMTAIHNLAFMYVFTGNAAYAKKATDILDAWATTQTTFGGDENFLDLGDYSSFLFPGADILKYTYPGWTAANTAHVNSYFNNVLWPVVDVPNPTRGHNQGAIQLKAALALAVSLDDATKWQQALASYRGDAGGGLANSLPNGEVGDTGRDEGHWFGQVEALSWSAEVAWKQGVDMYSELNNRLLATSELYTGYNTSQITFSASNPFIPFGGTYAYYTGPSGVSGQRRQSYLYNIINGAYPLRKGISSPYTDAFRSLVNGASESTPSFLYRKSADASTAAALPPIVHPSAASATNLSNTDVGTVGLKGSASFSNGTWSVTGAGADIPVPALASPDAFNYAFQQVTGDAVIVAKVTSVGNTDPNARAGLMFRETFADNARHVGIFLQPAGVANLTWRAATAFSKTSVSWNNPPGGYLPHGGPVAPWWLKLERLGNKISAFHSQDGVNWTCLGVVVSPMPNSVYVGLAVTSHNTSALNTSTFTDVSVTSPAPTGSPVITSSTAAAAVVGTAFSYAVTATNAPTSYTATGLPAGLSIDAATGVISGTPTAIGTSYVTIGAANGSGTGTATLVLTVTSSVAPAAPTGVTLTNPGLNQVAVSWNAVANATSYSVKRSLTASGPYTTVITNVTGTSFLDTNAFPGYNYYVVTALAGSLESAPSAEASIVLSPDVPATPTITSGNNQLTLTWPAATGAASYNVKRSLVSGGPYTTVATGLTATSYVDNAVTNGTTYYYVVSSVLAARESANSTEVLGVPGSSTATWSATPTSNVWNLGANWDGGVVPTSPALLGFNSSSTTTLTNDLTGLQVARITFNAGASAFTMGGNALALGSDITNNSTNTQTLNMPMSLDRPLSVNVTAGPIVLGGVLSGSGGIVKRGANNLSLTGENTYSGGTTIYDSNGGWPPSSPLIAGGVGAGTSGNPTSGALGIGPVTLSGGALMNTGNPTLYNNITLQAGTKSYLYVNTSGSLTLAGRLLGSGTVESDVASTGALHFTGDNSGFTGTYISVNRSSNSRIRFDNANSGSANANWILNSTFTDSHGFTFGSATISFGALSGTGYFRNDGGGVPIMSIGALNTSTTFAGFIIGTVGVAKVGTGTLAFTGTSTYSGATNVNSGTLLITAPGSIASAVQVNGGTFGGSGTSSGALVAGTGTGSGATLAPGDNAVGTLTTGALTLNPDATYAVEYNTPDGSADKVVASAVTLNNATLAFTQLSTGTLPMGTNITLLDNRGSAAVTGTFNNLPELALVTLGGYNFRLTYKGGTGNDVVLLDNRTNFTITSAATASGLVGQAFSYTITGINSPSSFSATNLPAGLSINPTTGVISGTPTTVGTYSVTLSAGNGTYASTQPLTLTVYNNAVSGVLAAGGDARNIIDWDSNPFATSFNVKRATTAGGPYTTIAANVTGSRYIDSPVTNGTTYYYVVSLLIGSNESANSAEAIAQPGPNQVAYYKFNEASGTRGVDSWGGLHATLQATATRSTGYDGTALKLDGTATSYATLPTGVVSGLTDFTISSWVKMDAISSYMRVFDFGNSGTQYMFLTVQAGTSGTQSIVRYAVKNGSAAEQNISYNYTFPLNTWVYLTVTQSGTTAKLYLNGSQAATGTISILPSALGSTTLNYLGKSQAADPLLKGSIDEFKIYNRALTANEVATSFTKAPIITSAAIASASVNQPFSYTITAANSPTSFTATGLPAGMSLNTSTGVISGTATVTGTYAVTISATNAFGTDTKPLAFTVYNSVVTGLIVAGGDTRNILDWDDLPVATSFNIKRATTAGGPYPTIATNVTGTRYIDSPVTNGTIYYYVVSAVDTRGENPNSPEVVAKPNVGQVAYYKFNEASGTRGVDSWGGLHATLQATATRSAGYDGTALQLDGSTNSYATLPTDVVNGLTNFTISSWVKMDAIATWMRVFDFGSSTTQYMFLTVQAGTSGTQSIVRYAIKNGSAAEQNINFNYTFPLSTWVHLAVTQSGTTTTLFINGLAVATGTITVAPLGSTTLNYLGKSQFADPLFKGAIDEFKIYSRALSAAEIANNALANLVVSNAQNLQGSYNNVTITGAATGGAGAATLTGGLTVAGTLTVQNGGMLNTNCQALTGSGDFVLQAGGELRICDAAGIMSTGTTGSIQVAGTRTFSPDANYTYIGAAAQTTGTALPSRTRNLTINNASGVTLTAPTSVGQMLSLTNGNLNLAGQGLTLLSDAAGTAMVVNTNGVVNGTATVQRYITPSYVGTSYRHYSSPVLATTVADLATPGFTPIVNSAYNTAANPYAVTPFPTVYDYNTTRLASTNATTSAFDFGWESPVALTTPLTRGLGYSVNIPSTEVVDFVGTLNNGPLTLTNLTRASQNDAGWQLLGNPYPSPLDWDAVTTTGLDATVYVSQATGPYAGRYSSYVRSGVGTNGGTNQLALGQGFFVRTTSTATPGTISFANAARVTTYANPTFQRTAGSTFPLVRLDLHDATGAADEAVVYFPGAATTSFDAEFDAYKLNGSGPLLSSEVGPALLSINGLPALGTATVTVPLRIWAAQAGSHTLRATELLNLPAGTRAYLRDAQTGTLFDLSQATGYTVSLAAGATTGRFTLLLNPNQPLATTASSLSQQVTVFPNPTHGGSVSLSLPAELLQKALEVELLNSLGQTVLHQTLSASSDVVRTLTLPELAAGLYTVRLQSSVGVVTKRLTIN